MQRGTKFVQVSAGLAFIGMALNIYCCNIQSVAEKLSMKLAIKKQYFTLSILPVDTFMDNKEVQKKIGENIEHIRLLKKKTIKEIASSINLSDTGYRNIERGMTDISVSKLFYIASILGVSHLDLLALDVESFIRNNGNDKLSAHYKKQLEENFQQRIQQYKEENLFLKRQIEILENMLANHEMHIDKNNRYRTG